MMIKLIDPNICACLDFFSFQENGLIGFTITNIYLSFHELPPPQALSLTLTQNGIPGYIYASTFATDCNDIMNCTNYQPNQTEVSFELAIPNVSEIAFILEGFQSEVSAIKSVTTSHAILHPSVGIFV